MTQYFSRSKANLSVSVVGDLQNHSAEIRSNYCHNKPSLGRFFPMTTFAVQEVPGSSFRENSAPVHAPPMIMQPEDPHVVRLQERVVFVMQPPVIVETPDYCSTLLSKSNVKLACLCIHSDTSVAFGGWVNCANTSIPRGRDHSVRNTIFYACANQDGQKGNIKLVQRSTVFRKKDKKTEEEGLRFCHLEDSSDHARRYREVKHGPSIEKLPNRLGPPFRLVQFKETLHHPSFLEDIDAGENNGNR